MTDRQLRWTEAELLASHDVAEPLVVAGRRCHGGYLSDGTYVSPRTKGRVAAIAAWQAQHRDDFGTEILSAAIETWPEPYPNVAQTRFLLRHGVRGPVITSLTRIGTVEGFGALVRHVGLPDIQRHFVESVDATATAHLAQGLFEAHARDEAGWGDEGGHDHMWFAARDVAFEHPVTADETERMLARLGIAGGPAAGSGPGVGAPQAVQVHADLDPSLEAMLRRMLSILFIEVSAFHTFAWAEEVLSDPELTAGEGAAARIVSHIRADETPHVDYLRTALTEMRARTFIGTSGAHLPGTRIIDTLWERALADSLGARRSTLLKSSLAEVEDALAGHARGADLLAEFHALGSVRPDASGELVAVSA